MGQLTCRTTRNMAGQPSGASAQPVWVSFRPCRLTRFQTYCIQQSAETAALTLDLISCQRIRLRAQIVDNDLAIRRQVDGIDDTAERPRSVFSAPFPVVIIEKTVSADVAKPRYPVRAPTGEILFPVATTLQPRYVRIAELHLGLLTTFGAMRATHCTTEVTKIVKSWGRHDERQHQETCNHQLPFKGMTTPSTLR